MWLPIETDRPNIGLSVSIGNHSAIHLIEMISSGFHSVVIFLYEQGQLSVTTYEIGLMHKIKNIIERIMH